MTTSSKPIDPLVQRFALITCVVALLPIGIGALVTTLKAGMAFADWPTSDGHNMLLYPWLNDLRHTDKFLEHGHRLAGVVIGLVSIGLVFVTFRRERRQWVRMRAVIILLAVIGQGLLGGMRVRMNEQALAMIHSITGALFFSCCVLFAVAVRRNPDTSDSAEAIRPTVFAIGALLPFLVLGQYILGGFFRHFSTMLHEHLAGAAIVGVASIVVATAGMLSKTATFRKPSRWLALAILVQVSLGVGSWVTRMGLPQMGWVATVNSPAQNVFCSLHTVGGMALFAASAVVAAELFRLAGAGRVEGFGNNLPADAILHSGAESKRGLA